MTNEAAIASGIVVLLIIIGDVGVGILFLLLFGYAIISAND